MNQIYIYKKVSMKSKKLILKKSNKNYFKISFIICKKYVIKKLMKIKKRIINRKEC